MPLSLSFNSLELAPTPLELGILESGLGAFEVRT